MARWQWLGIFLFIGGTSAAEPTAAPVPRSVTLRAPLTTVVEAPTAPAGDRVLRVVLVVSADAPADLGVGAFAEDRDGRWFRCAEPLPLPPGRHVMAFPLTADAALVAEPDRAAWRADAAAVCDRAGLYLWSTAASRATVTIESLVVARAAPAAPAASWRLGDLALDGMDATAGVARGRTGERWALELVPTPFPANPYDPAQFALDLLVDTPAGGAVSLPGFYRQPMRGLDRGNREEVTATGPGRFCIRFRPSAPGRHRLSLIATWPGHTVAAALPDLVIEGPARADTVQVDANDPRFFTIGGRWYWPVGLNLHSSFDRRSQEVMATRLTPARGTLVYGALLERLAAAGGDATEIWMSSWNLALEWRADWPGYAGLGRYNQANAWRLDQVLDQAGRCGVRVNLVLNNHGQASPQADREWKDNPYGAGLGGPLDEPIELFENPAALAGQERLRRYLVARYADHPAILGWKLWSEVDLTAARGEVVWKWHEQAAARWHLLDVYHHPVTTHWAGDFRRVNPQVADLPGIDYLCIDAYRNAAPGRDWRPLADILADSTTYPHRGLARYRKPVLVTEFGAGSGASPEACRAVDHRTGAWAALVSGHGGAPMLWWWEWVDQGNRWQPYGAIRRFLASEDARGAAARSAVLAAAGPAGALWARAWTRPGRMLGYLQDPRWGATGDEPTRLAGVTVEIGDAVAAGGLRLEWWDADTGAVVATRRLAHPGGALRLAAPPFAGHLAFKLWRDGNGRPADAEPRP